LKQIAVIAGDGIGVDVTREAVKILDALRQVNGLPIELKHYDWDAERYLRTGETLPAGALDMFRNEYAAIFIGAYGDPRVPDMKHAADILLGIRFGLDLYINLRPVKLLDDRLCPLKDRTAKDVDMVVFRENTEGAYVGAGGFLKKGTSDEIAIQEDINTRKGVERIIVAAFEYARKHGRRKVTMSDKSNVMNYAHNLWQRVFKEVSSRYSDIEANHMFVDALTMSMVLKPQEYDVIVTNNMFGDIVTDLGAALQGGLGIAASGNIHPGQTSMFEPVHGSAPKYAGKNVANPFGALLTAAMMLDYVGLGDAASAVENAVLACINANETTNDIGGNLGTKEVGDAVLRRLRN
jgi:3-isopropylmalate dehydrogenase